MFGGEEAVGRFLVGDGDVESAEFFLAEFIKRAWDVAGLNIEERIMRGQTDGFERGVVHRRR